MSQRRYRNPALVGMSAVCCLVAGALFDLYLVVEILDRGAPPVGIGSTIPLILTLCTIVTFLIWMDRMYSNVEALDGSPEHGLHWATTGFFVPPLFLFRPYQIVNEAWLHSHARPDRRRVPWVLALWWMAFLVSRGLGLSVYRDAIGHLHLLRSVSSIIAAVAAIGVVLIIVRDQQSLHSLRTRRERERHAAELRERRRVIAGTGSSTSPGTGLPADTPAGSVPRAIPVPTAPAVTIAPSLQSAAAPPAPRAPQRAASDVPRRPPVVRAAPAPASTVHWSSIAGSRLWHGAATASVLIAAVAMMAGAAVLASRQDMRSLVPAGVYAVYAIILFLLGAGLRSARFQAMDAKDSAPRALMLVALALINVAVVTGVLLS